MITGIAAAATGVIIACEEKVQKMIVDGSASVRLKLTETHHVN